jgi:hypothetical protein
VSKKLIVIALATNGRTSRYGVVLVAPNIGRTLCGLDRKFNFANEFARGKLFFDSISTTKTAKVSRLAIIYLHVSETFAFSICSLLAATTIGNFSECNVSLVFRKSSCKKIFDDYNATPLD